jgi:hypothetical protein
MPPSVATAALEVLADELRLRAHLAPARGNTESALEALLQAFRISRDDAPDKPSVPGRNLGIEAIADEGAVAPRRRLRVLGPGGPSPSDWR